ncbi:sulfur carrier protein ThiS [Thiorhodospira sibirica]|uniref:sulfur carrier protein ThiS n=1 Tax=Thiorhodospira sibirica TaxID=154347 RepID=UPI00022C0513|nr:sulfur carrier protein ThiS [Thiorhodospira sibirica]
MKTSIEIHLNGAAKPLPAGLTAAELLTELNLVGQRLAVEINGEILPRSCFEDYCFKAGDRVEIVHAVGGG